MARVYFARSLLLAALLSAGGALGEPPPPRQLPLVHRHFSNTDGLPDTAVPALLQTRDGFLWVGSAGLARFNGVSFQQLNEATTPGLGESDLRALAEDERGGLWLGGAEAGGRGPMLGRLERGRLTRFGSAQGLRGREVLSLDAGPSGTVWVGTETGADRLENGRLSPVPGLRGPVLALLERKGGELLAGTPEGLGAGALEIAYDAPSLRVPERVRFRFRMEGPGEPWSGAGPRRVASFHSLPSGRYVFQVTAANDDGLWNETGATLTLTLAPPLWRTGWFASLCVLALAGAVFGSFRWWTEQSRRRERLLRAQVDERTSQLVAANRDLARNLEELGRAQQHLVASDRRTSLGLLAAGVAHEINNPLAYITNNLAFIRDALPELAADREKETRGALAPRSTCSRRSPPRSTSPGARSSSGPRWSRSWARCRG